MVSHGIHYIRHRHKAMASSQKKEGKGNQKCHFIHTMCLSLCILSYSILLQGECLISPFLYAWKLSSVMLGKLVQEETVGIT